MSNNFLIHPLFDLKNYKDILDNIKTDNVTAINGLQDSQKAHMAYALCKSSGYKGVFIAPNEFKAKQIHQDFSELYDQKAVLFPFKEIILHDIDAQNNDMTFERVKVLDKIIRKDFQLVVISIESVLQKLSPKSFIIENSICFEIDMNTDFSGLAKKFISIGYEKVDIVEAFGQFSIRGGIIDVFPVTSKNPIRIEFFDDQVDSIREFDVETQRSLEMLDSTVIIPCKETIYDLDTLPEIIKNIRDDLNKISINDEYYKKLTQNINLDIEKLENEFYFSGMERLKPYFLKNPASILDYFDDDVILFMDSPDLSKKNSEILIADYIEVCKSFMEKGRILYKAAEMFFDYSNIFNKIRLKTIIFREFLIKDSEFEFSRTFNIISKPVAYYNKQIKLFIKDIKEFKNKKYRIVIFLDKKEKAISFLNELKENGIFATYIETYEKTIQKGDIFIVNKYIKEGFEYPEVGFMIISEKEIFGEEISKLKFTKKIKSKKLDLFTDLDIGDYVVHYSHGIGQYLGIEEMKVDNVKKDYLKIKYMGENYLYVPINQMDLIQKYIGSEGKTPKLNKLGGLEWSKAKAKVKESLMELAKELIILYAKREAQKKTPFLEDTVWQKQFEEAFPYEETDDQLKAIYEIKKDMESDRPMDRLLCGDVGYGKTEVALRAIFKAVMSGKQVAYLVPTTVLAQQQYMNFKQRISDFPATIELLSRYRTPNQQKEILKDLKAGHVDIVVGTHRIIQKDIKFKNLGLLVVDEEQRFGVLHKERLKNINSEIDVLTLTATPIPRTLHMSLSGIRDISTLEDPPQGRFPVQTYVMEYDEEVIRNAIMKELSRGGQVFYLFNRVKDISLKEFQLSKLMPEAKIAVAHGQMEKHMLEEVMTKFLEHEYNVLICTTIIESGLDMPDVNTIIVEDADKMGLAQLYQLRGRVGRSDKLAYAYITYKKDKVLSEIAEKRLRTIKEFTEFGSGFKIAMRDLQIRGAGNLLGKQQHGHMDAVGYDMYCKLLHQAVGELRGDNYKEQLETTIDINIDAYIPDHYIYEEHQKIEMYKKISLISDEEDLINLRDELLDRYGEIPQPVENLMYIANIKASAKQYNIKNIQQTSDFFIVEYHGNTKIDFKEYDNLVKTYKGNIILDMVRNPIIKLKLTNIGKDNLLANIKILLQSIKNLNQGK